MAILNLEEDASSDHAREMATYFQSELDESNNASTITMDNDKAKGFISSYRVFSGLTVWIYNVTFLSDFNVDFGLSEYRPCYFSYNVKGHFLHRFSDQEEFVDILQNQNMIVMGNPENTSEVIFPANVKLEIALLVVDNDLLGNLDTRNAKRLHSEIQKLFKGIPKDRAYRYLGEIDGETGKYASIVCANNEVTLVAALFTEGAVLNMLASQLKSYMDVNHEADLRCELTKFELSKITSLGTYVIEHPDLKITSQKLSEVFHLGPRKLQIGVKQLYGDTVASYILNVRLVHAKHLFLTTDCNVSEVCYKVGLTNESHFCRVFRQRFGITPGMYKKNMLANAN
jgi:AraC-like DNA-binding protein